MIRYCSGAKRNQDGTKPGTIARNEADTNADTCCLGTNFTVLSYTSRTADVYPYDSSYEPVRSVPIVTGATTYHHPNGEAFIIIINEALYYGDKLDHSLINPNQVQYNGVGFRDNPYDHAHNLEIEVYEKVVTIPMQYYGKNWPLRAQLPRKKS